MEHTAIIATDQYGNITLDCTCGYSCYITFPSEAAAQRAHNKHVAAN